MAWVCNYFMSNQIHCITDTVICLWQPESSVKMQCSYEVNINVVIVLMD
jgi:hypothetical protein